MGNREQQQRRPCVPMAIDTGKTSCCCRNPTLPLLSTCLCRSCRVEPTICLTLPCSNECAHRHKAAPLQDRVFPHQLRPHPGHPHWLLLCDVIHTLWMSMQGRNWTAGQHDGDRASAAAAAAAGGKAAQRRRSFQRQSVLLAEVHVLHLRVPSRSQSDGSGPGPPRLSCALPLQAAASLVWNPGALRSLKRLLQTAPK